jgi:5-methylcytosine-specific restriction protein B
LNRQIDDKNYEVGISFFIDDDLELNLPSIWQLEIEPYLEEFFLGQANKVEPFRWNKVLERLGE